MSKGNKSEGKQVKMCPFLGAWCDEEAMKNCTMSITLTKHGKGGIMHKRMCIFMALGEIMSEINQKTEVLPQPEQPQIILPFMGRG